MTCQCYTAVTRAYANLREKGVSEEHAYTASVRVYRHHHPDQSKAQAFDMVADWLDSLESGTESPTARH